MSLVFNRQIHLQTGNSPQVPHSCRTQSKLQGQLDEGNPKPRATDDMSHRLRLILIWTYTLDCGSFLLRHANNVGTWWNIALLAIKIALTNAKKLHQGLWVLSQKLSQGGITRSKLMDQRLNEIGVLSDVFTELLKLRAVLQSSEV